MVGYGNYQKVIEIVYLFEEDFSVDFVFIKGM